MNGLVKTERNNPKLILDSPDYQFLLYHLSFTKDETQWLASMKKSIHIRFEGKVQKVGFRNSCKMIATNLGIKGSAINLKTGGVELSAWGEAEALKKMVEELRLRFSISDEFELPALGDCKEQEFRTG